MDAPPVGAALGARMRQTFYSAAAMSAAIWNFLASGIVFVSSSVFQGMGNTLPPLAASALRLLLFALPVYAISHQPGFQLRQVWCISVASVTVQLVVNLWLLHREFGRKLAAVPAPDAQPAAAT
jgi:Na+-driven multidrug efflux pump